MDAIRSILLHLDDSDRTAARVAIAAALAEHHDATVSATYAVVSSLLRMAAAGSEGTSLFADTWRQLDDQRRGEARERFDACNAGPRLVYRELDEAAIVPAIVRGAFTADLLVLGQHDKAARGPQGTPANFVESVVIDIGRPAIVVPYAGSFRDVGGQVLVAWKPTRESARAVTAALPLLKRARAVHVASWGDDPREVEPLLLAHGVQARYHAEGEPPRHLAEAVLSRAADFDADLIVMGCYGHGRAREWVLGGVSRGVLDAMTVPALLAH
ncbi:universal stress protein [Aquabacterium sp. J223]|uniref:universal stress protein n=1 Tax=Aquabacterium sp. J223 TaxID=2898431 RepID=UPI0021AE1B05|nr:universal stress protein [Aquabacterium sp. J223]UUX95034.1 universal stress protein [Aquabacterium sp. J223]